MPDTSSSPTGPEIAKRAQELKILHLTLMLTQPLIFHPELPALQALLAINGQTPKDLMSISMLLGGTRIGDMITKGSHSRKDVPLLQFARHFRNAGAHGDRWDFRAGQPETPAICRGLTLTADLHGQRATWTTVTPRLYVEFLDDVSNYFVPGFAPPPGRETT